MSVLTSVCATCGIFVAGLLLLRRWRVRRWGWCSVSAGGPGGEQLMGRLAVVTGASSGLGLELATQLASRHATVVLACSELSRAETAVILIRRRTHLGQLIPMQLDLADLNSVRAFVKSYGKLFDHLDILVNNAGVHYPPGEFHTTKQGHEAHFGVNHLGHFLLTLLLLPFLRKTMELFPKSVVCEYRQPRIVIIASYLYRKGRFNADSIASGDTVSLNWSTAAQHRSRAEADPDRSAGWLSTAYCNSKLCNVLFARNLSRLLLTTGVEVYTVCPGWVFTRLFRHSQLSWWRLVLLAPVALLFMRSVGQGVQTQLSCCLGAGRCHQSGRLYRDCRPIEYELPDTFWEDADALWRLSERLAGVKFRTDGTVLDQGAVTVPLPSI